MSDPTGKNIMSLNMWLIFMSHNRMLCSLLNIKFLCHTISIPCAHWYKTNCINCPLYILHFVTYGKKHFISLSFIILGMMKSYDGLFRSLLGLVWFICSSIQSHVPLDTLITDYNLQHIL